VASPLLLTVATLVALLAQLKVTPLTVFPFPSFAVALNCSEPFKATEGALGVSVMLATAAPPELDPELPCEEPAQPSSMTVAIHTTISRAVPPAKRERKQCVSVIASLRQSSICFDIASGDGLDVVTLGFFNGGLDS
jgi:hypothetical protein